MILPGIWWLSFVCFLTLLGNVLVILAVYRETSLHSATYYYIVSLAVADLCVGVIVIPLAIFFELATPSSFDILCHLWHVTDVGASTASILALCIIALDRYIAITSPIRYPRSFIARHLSIVIAGPTVVILGGRTKSNRILSNETRCEFPSDPVFIIVSSLVSFYIPLIIMMFIYGRILVFAQSHDFVFEHRKVENHHVEQGSKMSMQYLLYQKQ
jgi:dopamine D2-like receptor